jgi:hypothetical protein
MQVFFLLSCCVFYWNTIAYIFFNLLHFHTLVSYKVVFIQVMNFIQKIKDTLIYFLSLCVFSVFYIFLFFLHVFIIFLLFHFFLCVFFLTFCCFFSFFLCVVSEGYLPSLKQRQPRQVFGYLATFEERKNLLEEGRFR